MGIFGYDIAASLADEAVDQPVRQVLEIILVLLEPRIGQQAGHERAVLGMLLAVETNEMRGPGNLVPVSIELLADVVAFRFERQRWDGTYGGYHRGEGAVPPAQYFHHRVIACHHQAIMIPLSHHGTFRS